MIAAGVVAYEMRQVNSVLVLSWGFRTTWDRTPRAHSLKRCAELRRKRNGWSFRRLRTELVISGLYGAILPTSTQSGMERKIRRSIMIEKVKDTPRNERGDIGDWAVGYSDRTERLVKGATDVTRDMGQGEQRAAGICTPIPAALCLPCYELKIMGLT
jgi:hypothetical protein